MTLNHNNDYFNQNYDKFNDRLDGSSPNSYLQVDRSVQKTILKLWADFKINFY